MNLKLFTLKFSSELGGFDDAAMRQFLVGKEVASFQQYGFAIDGKPYWAVLLKYASHDGAAAEKSGGEAKTQPAQERDGGVREYDQNSAGAEKRNGGSSLMVEHLTPGQRQLFEAMRSWRLKRAQAKGVELYKISNNNQLANIARAKPMNMVALSTLEGVKPSFVRDYGQEILDLCRQS